MFVVRRIPVIVDSGQVVGNIGAVRATEARLDAALVVEVALQVALLYVSLVTAGPWTRVVTFGIVFWIGNPGARGEGVGFVRSASSVLGVCTGALRGLGGRL